MNLTVPQRLRTLQAHVWRRLGWPGMAGLICMVVALILAVQVHRATALSAPAATQTQSAVQATQNVKVAPPGNVISAPQLPQRADVPALLSQIELQTKEHGLAWPQAEYRLTPLSADHLSELELSFTLQGSYPKVRALLSGLLDGQPALALRDLSLRRPHSDVAEVEAKIVLVIFLRDGWPLAVAAPAPASLSTQAGASP